MAQCPWCEKSLPGSNYPACGSCILRHPSQELEKSQTSEKAGVGIDLSHLNNSDLDKTKKEKQNRKGKSPWQVHGDLIKSVRFKQLVPQEELVMKMRKVKSNSIRDRAFVAYDLVLHFNGMGIAQVPESKLHLVEDYMRLRPGRLSVVEEEEVSEVEETEPEEKVEESPKVPDVVTETAPVVAVEIKEEPKESKKTKKASYKKRKSKKTE
jgi:hypothetical protein